MAYWSGKFYSSTYGSLAVQGIITADNIDLNKDEYQSLVVMKYTGIYRFGEVLKLTANVKGNLITAELGHQKVSFRVDLKTQDVINGEYDSVNPMDKGHFELHPGTDPSPNSGCNIM
jgi:hypothetical protein